jgi:hypothetical protein
MPTEHPQGGVPSQSLTPARNVGMLGLESPCALMQSYSTPGAVTAFEGTLQSYGRGRVTARDVRGCDRVVPCAPASMQLEACGHSVIYRK